MNRVPSLAVTCLCMCALSAGLVGQVREPGHRIPVTVLESTGVISGTVTSTIGRPLSGITIEAVDEQSGVIAGQAPTTRDGGFRITEIDPGMYTLQCVDDGRVIGTKSVKGPAASVTMVCAADPGYWKKWGLLTVLAAAGSSIGAAVVPRGSVASPSR